MRPRAGGTAGNLGKRLSKCRPGEPSVNINLRRAAAMEAAEAVIETTSSDVKVDALCVTAHGIVAVGSKMDGRTWHGEVHRKSPR